MPKRALPKHVTLVNGRIVYRPYIKKAERDGFETNKHGYLKTPIKLGVPGDTDEAIYRAYIAACEALRTQSEPGRGTLRWLSGQYMRSRKFRELATDSQRKAASLNRVMDHPIKINGADAKLGELMAKDLTSPTVRRIMNKRLDDYQAAGKKGNVQCNRELAHISTVYAWGLQHFEDIGLTKNPCKGITRFKEQPKQRYVTDEEYFIALDVAKDVRDYLPVVMKLAYLLASRGIEVPEIKITDCTEEGIRVHRRKGSSDTGIQWSPFLREAYDEAMALHKTRKVSGIYLVPGPKKSDGKLRKGTLDTAMQDLKKEMTNRGMQETFFPLHDLKRKGVTDAENNRIAGHKSSRIREQYDVKVKMFKPPK